MASYAREARSAGLPRPRPMRSIVLALSLTLTACASTQFERAPLTCDTGCGTVRGWTADDVAEVGRLVRDLAPLVREAIRPEHSEPVRVVVLDEAADPYAEAYTHEFVRDGRLVDRVIVVGSRRKHLRGFVVAHEIVHWMADGPWDRLPLALEEGLADLVAGQLDPVGREAKDYDLAHVPPASSFEEIEAALRASRETWDGLRPSERDRAYWVGAIVARRLGVDGLRALAVEAARSGAHYVSSGAVIDRLGLGRDVAAWNEAAPR